MNEPTVNPDPQTPSDDPVERRIVLGSPSPSNGPHVFKAIDRLNGRDVLIRFFGASENDRFVQKVLHDANRLLGAAPRGIVPVLWTEPGGRRPYIAHWAGPHISLEIILRRHGHLSLESALLVLEPIAEAADFAHQNALTPLPLHAASISICPKKDHPSGFDPFLSTPSTSSWPEFLTLAAPGWLSPDPQQGGTDACFRSPVSQFARLLADLLGASRLEVSGTRKTFALQNASAECSQLIKEALSGKCGDEARPATALWGALHSELAASRPGSAPTAAPAPYSSGQTSSRVPPTPEETKPPPRLLLFLLLGLLAALSLILINFDSLPEAVDELVRLARSRLEAIRDPGDADGALPEIRTRPDQ